MADRRHNAAVGGAWEEVSGLVTELQAEFGFRADPDKLELCRRKVFELFQIDLCKGSTKAKKPCPYRASKGGYCGLHSKARQSEKEAEIRKRVADEMPKHSHAFGVFVEDCPACRASSLVPGSSQK